jgi:hypothetical protein
MVHSLLASCAFVSTVVNNNIAANKNVIFFIVIVL